MIPLTTQVQNELRRFLSEGSITIDATAGNGYDTVFLAEQVGDPGQVYAFDIQHQAIEKSRARLQKLNLDHRVTLIEASHENLRIHIPEIHQQQISVIMFNLGFLPGTDKTCITQTHSTMSALKQSVELLKPEGALSIMLYPGHEGGQQETNAVLDWGNNLPTPWKIRHNVTAGPQWMLVTREQSEFS